MEVEFAFIAEAADAQSGLFYVTRGGTDIWNVPPGASFPVRIGPMSFIVRLRGSPNEVGSKIALRSMIVDADGRQVGGENQGEIELPPHPLDRTRSGSALLHFRVAAEIPRPGAYLFELHHDERRVTAVPFWVVEGPLSS